MTLLARIVERDALVSLQVALSSVTACGDDAGDVRPHHPTNCNTELRLELDGMLTCDHTAAPSGNLRTHQL